MLTAEIIAIGSELLTPEKSDTNSLWLTARLNEIGIEVMLKTIVGDDAARLEEIFRDALRRSDIVISTGGLGPTEDDITRRVSAQAIGRELVFKDEIVNDLIERFRRWGREMPEINKRQAYVIEGAEILPNPNGSAVGMLVETEGKFLVILPGPPRELKPMFEDFILPKLRARAGDVSVKRKVLKVAGMGESAVDEKVAPVYLQYENPQTTILFNRSEVEIHLTARGATEPQADELNEEVARKITDVLGIAVFSTDGEKMESVVGKMLAEKNETLSVAESCTGGLIAERLTEIPGSSSFFIEGAIVYANKAKVRSLGVSQKALEKYGAVSKEVAEEMARGMREKSQTNYAISVTGIAGPAGGSEEKPVGLIFIGYADESEMSSIKIILPGDRHLIRWRASQAALDLLRRKLLKKNSSA